MFFYFIISFVLSLSFLWSIPFLLFTLFEWQLYQIKEKEKVVLLSSKVKNSSIKKDDNKPSGIFIGYYYIGIFIDKEQSSEVFMLCSTKKFLELTSRKKSDEDEEQEKKEEITIYERKGNFFWMEYSKRQFNVTHFRMRENQEKIIDDMSMYYINSRTNNCTSLIYGEPGSGKSMIPILLAKKWMSTIVRTFNPSEPGDSISSLYNEVNPSEDKPLIIVLDEVDIMIDKIHHNKIIPHKHIPTQVQDKTSWNRFLDDFNLGLFPYVILVLTSNLSADSIKIKYDPSYIREGRVNISIQL